MAEVNVIISTREDCFEVRKALEFKRPNEICCSRDAVGIAHCPTIVDIGVKDNTQVWRYFRFYSKSCRRGLLETRGNMYEFENCGKLLKVLGAFKKTLTEIADKPLLGGYVTFTDKSIFSRLRIDHTSLGGLFRECEIDLLPNSQEPSVEHYIDKIVQCQNNYSGNFTLSGSILLDNIIRSSIGETVRRVVVPVDSGKPASFY